MTYRERIIKDFEYQVTKAHREGWDFVDITVEDGYKILALLQEHKSSIGKWISVKDRIPEKSGKYLICAIGDGEQRVTTAYCGNYFYMVGRMAHWRVTHWMPLPEPPKEKTK